jgi:hypothetical protein
MQRTTWTKLSDAKPNGLFLWVDNHNIIDMGATCKFFGRVTDENGEPYMTRRGQRICPKDIKYWMDIPAVPS